MLQSETSRTTSLYQVHAVGVKPNARNGRPGNPALNLPLQVVVKTRMSLDIYNFWLSCLTEKLYWRQSARQGPERLQPPTLAAGFKEAPGKGESGRWQLPHDPWPTTITSGQASNVRGALGPRAWRHHRWPILFASLGRLMEDQRALNAKPGDLRTLRTWA